MTTIETVCFDLDNTLCVNTQSNEEIHRTLFERVGLEPCFSVSDVQNVDPASLPEVDSEQAFYEELYRAVTGELDPAAYRELAETTLEIIDETDVTFRDGAAEAFRYVRDRYDDVGLLTYGDPDIQREKLDRLGIEEQLDAALVCGPDTDVTGKPDPEPFETVLSELGAAPETSIYVGDSLQGDIAGAHRVGMHSAWVPTSEIPADPEPEPTYVLDSPAELQQIL